MKQFNELTKYLNHEFSSYPWTGSDYKTFQNTYVAYLRAICMNNNWRLASVSRNHYCFSAFIECDGCYVYLSICDVRFSHDWFNHILIRTATTEKDYRGGLNNYTTLADLENDLGLLLNKRRVCNA